MITEKCSLAAGTRGSRCAAAMRRSSSPLWALLEPTKYIGRKPQSFYLENHAVIMQPQTAREREREREKEREARTGDGRTYSGGIEMEEEGSLSPIAAG